MVRRMRLPLSLLLSAACLSRAESVWREGETPDASTMHRHPWWFDQVKPDLLSGGQWISNFSKQEGTATYRVTLAEKGPWQLWLRANPVGTTLSLAVDGRPWQAVDFEGDVRGQQNIAADGKPDLRFIAWVKGPKLELPAGAHELTFRMHGTADNHGGLDCFVLTNEGFVPTGLRKPGAEPPPGPDTWFPVVAEDDPFAADSVFAAVPRTGAPAGRHGPVTARGAALVFAGRPGEPVKFWGCNASLDQDRHTREQLRQRVRYLAKFGCNAVRQHPLFDEISRDGKIDPQRLEVYDWWFAELKRAGIHTQWSVFYHFPIGREDGYDAELFAELEPMGGKGLRDTYGLMCMSPELWALRTRILTQLLAHRNPHTGLRYADDPALMAVEFQNEDSIFFWNPLGELANPQTKKWPKHARKLRRLFAQWAARRHGDAASLTASWGPLDPADRWGDELLLMGPWELDQGGIRGRFAGRTARAADTIRFLAEMQRWHYEACEKAVRETGFKGQTVTTNWLGGSGLLDQANLWTDTAASMVDRHNYAGGGAGGHGIAEGQVFADSHLGKPGAELFAIALKQVAERPFSVSEWTMCPPNQWKLEAAPIMAFHGMGLQGWDASFHFAQSGTRFGEGWPGMSSYATDTPHYMGQWPALSLAVLRGDIREGDIVASRPATADAVMSGKPAWLQDHYDGDRLIRVPGATAADLFAAGRVLVDFSGKAATAVPVRRDGRRIESTTGELDWDGGAERILVKAPRTQAAVGRIAGRWDLPAALLDVRTGFASLILTSLDDLPLQESKRVMVTAMGRDRQTGAEYSEDGTRLVKVGTPPLLLEPVQASLTFKGRRPGRVRALDAWGVPRGEALPVAEDGGVTIDGRWRAWTYLIEF